jgi:hypothetical protein
MNGYFQDSDGNKSSSRLIACIVILYALILSSAIVLIGYIQKTPPMIIATAAGTIFTTIAGAAMVFLFAQKKTEEKAVIDKIEANKTTDSVNAT